MNIKRTKHLLISKIREVASHPDKYSVHQGIDFTRNRKLPMEKMISMIIGMSGGSLSNELLTMFHNSPKAASSSAFVQQRMKLKPDALEDIFRSFTLEATSVCENDLRILAVDGSDLQIFPDSTNPKTYYPGVNGQRPYGLVHLNALYDLSHQVFLDASVQGRNELNEHKALCSMVDRSPIKKALVIADRGYESYNSMAHIHEKGWFFLIRIKDGSSSIKGNLTLPDTDEFDLDIRLNITRKQSNETKKLLKDKNHYRFLPANAVFDYLPNKTGYKDPALYYELRFRIVRFPLSDDTFETVLTNLDREAYTPDALKKLYASRWGIESSFRGLKYTIGLNCFHSKKVMCIIQEIFARLIMYNFTQMITTNVIIDKGKRKHDVKINFSVAVHACRAFFLGDTAPPDMKAVLLRNLIPIRPARRYDRRPSEKRFNSFLYRLA